MSQIRTFSTFIEFREFDFTGLDHVQKVLTIGHTIAGIGAAEYSRMGTGIANTGNEGQLVTSDGTAWKLTSSPVSAEHFGALPKSYGSSAVTINRFLSYISENDVGSASFSGEYSVDAPITLGVDSTGENVLRVATRHIVGSPQITAIAPMKVVFYIRNFQLGIWNGKINVFGTGDPRWSESPQWQDRTCLCCVVISKCSRASFDGFYCKNASVYGLLCTSEGDGGGNANFINVGDCRFLGCGSGSHYGDEDFMTSRWYGRVDNDRRQYSGSAGQRTFIKADAIPSEEHTKFFTFPFIQLINGEQEGDLHFVRYIDRETSTIEVFPWIDFDLEAGRFRWVFGGGLGLRGADANVINASCVDATRCAIGLDMMSLYGPTIQRLGNHLNFAGMRFGLRPGGDMVSANIGALYTEGDTCAFIPLVKARHLGAYHIATVYALNLSTQVKHLKVRYRNNETIYGGLFGYTILVKGELLTYEKKPFNKSEGHSRLDLKIGNKDISRVFKKNRWTIRLSADMDAHSAFGYDSAQITMLGDGVNSAPTGSFEFTCEDSNARVNGADRWVASGFNGPAIFTVYYDIEDNNYIVAITNKSA
jgi:hypothetical protein